MLIDDPTFLRATKRRRDVFCSEEARQREGRGLQKDLVEDIGVQWSIRADVYRANSSLIGDLHESRGRVDGARSAHYQQDGREIELTIDLIHGERHLAEPDNIRADGTAAVSAPRQGACSFVELLVSERNAATHAARLEEAAVHVMNALGAGALMEVIDILCAEEEVVAHLPFDLGESFVGGVGLRRHRVAPPHGVELPDALGTLLPCFGSCDFLETISIPKPSGAAKGGETAFGGDARACKNEETILRV